MRANGSYSAGNLTGRTDFVAVVTLPEQPVISIRPSGNWAGLGFRHLWAYRELLYFLIWRDIKVRYKQTMLGAAWAIIQPLFTMLTFALLFGKLARIQSDNVPYPLFAYAGLLPWIFFSNAVSSSGNSLVGSSNLISKVYFPRLIIPAATVGAGILDFGIAFVILIALMVYYKVALTVNLFMLPVLVLLTMVLALAVGMWLSALNVKYRDIRHALPFLVQLWMFVTPIIYPISLVPMKWRWLLAVNPLSGIIEAYRSSILGHDVNWLLLAVSALATLVLFICSIHTFRRMEKTFSDII